MSKPIAFSKLSGSGNDFICIDGRDGRFEEILTVPDRAARFGATLCHRGTGIGADGVIFACRLDSEMEQFAHMSAKFFEPDGSQAKLCGNGTACFIHWAASNGWVPHGEIKILTPAGVVRGQDSDGEYVRVCIPLPEDMQTDLELDLGAEKLRCDFVVTGVPHVIAYVDDVGAVDVGHLGAALRRHERFQPRGANANFVQVLGPGRIAMRTFEFGVEGETLSCGTGAAAAAILAAMRFDWPKKFRSGEPVEVTARSGDVLRVHFTVADDGTIEDPCLETVVRFIYSGTVHPDLAERACAAGGGD